MARRTYQRRGSRSGARSAASVPGTKKERGGYWRALTTDTPGNPQKCGLSGKALVGTDTVPVEQASVAYFLTCKGTDPLPLGQIETSKGIPNEETGVKEYATDFRCAPTGETVETVSNGRTWYRPKFGFQQRTDEGWSWIECWDQVVLVEEAVARGFRAPAGHALDFHGGDRTTGTKHTVGQALTPLAVLASVLDDEVDPTPRPADEAVVEPTAPAAVEPGAERFRGLELD